MTEKKFFKRALWAPIAFPFLAWLAGLIVQPFSTLLYEAGSFMIMTLIFAGIPYLLFLFLLLRWHRNKTGSDIKKITLILPFAFLAIFWIYFSAYMIFLDGSVAVFKDSAFYSALLSSGQQVLLIAYGYVVAAHIVFFMFKLTNRIEPERNAKIISQKKPYEGIPTKKKNRF